MSFKAIKSHFLSLFRQIFVYHHRSLEFRCKLFAAMIVANKEARACEYEVLKEIAKEIYGNDEYRIEVMVRITKKYVTKVITHNNLDLDELLLEIDKEIKDHKRYVKKINLNHLRRFLCEGDEENQITQKRVLEFFEAQIREHSENS